MSKSSCRIGMIGQKFMGKAHANAFGQAKRFFDLKLNPDVVAVAARDQDSLKDFADRWAIPKRYADWRDMVADPEIDLIDIATPNYLHAEQAIAALEAGKHVVCEKPLAAKWADAQALLQAAEKSKQRTFVWFNYRRAPAVAYARMLVKSGRIGTLRHLRARYLQSWGGAETPLSWRFKKDLAGSGAHGDLNAHAIDLCRFISGDEITEVVGAMARTFHKMRPQESGGRGRSDVDDALQFMAALKSGGMASFEASRVATGHKNANFIELNGDLGSLRWDFERMNVLEFMDAQLPTAEQGWRQIICTTAGAQPWVSAWWPEAHVLGYEHGFTNQVADMMRILAGEPPEAPVADFAEAHRVQAILEAALRSAEERRPVAIAEVLD